MKNIYILLLGILLISGCGMSSGQISVVEVTVVNGSDQLLWEETQYINMTVLQPKNFDTNMTVRVYDLIVESPNSIIIGGIQDGEAFATISVLEIISNFSGQNFSRKLVSIDRDLASFRAYNGSAFLGNTNLDSSPLASAVTISSNSEGDNMALNKFNPSYYKPGLGQLTNENGFMEIIQRKKDQFTNATGDIRLGFYDNVNARVDFSIINFTNTTISMKLNDTEIDLYRDTYIDTLFAFNQTYLAGTPAVRTSPAPVVGRTVLFARDDGDLYLKKPNGNVRRITTANSGSNIWTEEQVFNNHTHFNGDVHFDNLVYNGGSTGFACIDGAGNLFKSLTACDVTLTTWSSATIANHTLGDETDS